MFITDAMALGYQVDSVYTDFSKAFDRVNPYLLLKKLPLWGFSNNIISWISSFITNRIQKAKVDNYISHDIFVTSGVPQGSHCAPVLFLIFINDLFEVIQSSNYLAFPDDLKIFNVVSKPEDVLKLQVDLDNIHQWCCQNQLYLNVEKCSQISFFRNKSPLINTYHINSAPLKTVRTINDLGVYFDSSLTFKQHIFNICNKSRRMWGFIVRTCYDFQVDTLKLLFTSLVRPLLEYVSPVWAPYYQTDVLTIEKIQHKFLRFAEYKLGITHIHGQYDHISKLLNLPSLGDRRIFIDLVTLYKLINDHLLSDDLCKHIKYYINSNRVTRNTPIFVIKKTNTNYSQFAPMNRFLYEANTYCSANLFNLEIKTFKKSLLTNIQIVQIK